ncbi:tRNA (N6-adenosine(37)-N6)-threonylcarbamoyltransferase complex ATPase TsaE [Borreliella mayonii]|uniref:tRNA threonylcarbamoyladenosine biosynthesis protein TsaE n=1 Tax=Borreliella mayonii TaxID=1674146 RepID=A0AAC9PJ25_9SPIR|nr:tRNA (adenosine(37)-N6)-threonylcarbamoyltransferase complex ATPase subunit type 1 TsaE [Borreliella mayonii]APS98405.1 tRNA (N6-adenosine(37)-N6)-threonylcarbamoyltransferase complex ATPase TsaE [Borreliella mayonii]APS99535.1 tRNA (N6-adenosine(37)-N6)-threonylcarbamoyltransferase complex ATPase TsaE [Borreliella mayonii]
MILEFKSEKKMINFSKSFFYPLPIGKIFVLTGDMGSGKTSFLKGLALNLGISYFTSPTYNIVNVYDFIDFKFYHIDLYRVFSLEEFELIGGLEILMDLDSIIAIEWPQIVLSIIPKDRLFSLTFKIVGSGRAVEFND